MNDATPVSRRASGKMTSSGLQLERFMFASPTQNSTKKKHQDVKPLIKTALMLLPITCAYSQKRTT